MSFAVTVYECAENQPVMVDSLEEVIVLTALVAAVSPALVVAKVSS